MSETMWAPTPWTMKSAVRARRVAERLDRAILDFRGEILAEVFYQTDHAVFQPVEAHARLFAAAPDLYAALGALTAVYARCVALNDELAALREKHRGGIVFHKRLAREMAEARAAFEAALANARVALAKADGR